MRWSLPLCALLMLATACGSEADSSTAQPPTTTVEGGLRILAYSGEPDNTDRDSPAQDLGGTIVELDGCIFIEGENGWLSFPRWPRGVTVEGDTIIVPESRHMDAARYHVGDDIRAGGAGPSSAKEAIQTSDFDDSTKAWALDCLQNSALDGDEGLVYLFSIRSAGASQTPTPPG